MRNEFQSIYKHLFHSVYICFLLFFQQQLQVAVGAFGMGVGVEVESVAFAPFPAFAFFADADFCPAAVSHVLVAGVP